MTAESRGLLDTSVVVAYDELATGILPATTAISATTLAELASGPHWDLDEPERSRRQDRLLWVTANWDPIPFDAHAARVYGRIYAVTRAAGQRHTSRLADMLIAATAVANGLPLFTRNPADFAHLTDILEVHAV